MDAADLRIFEAVARLGAMSRAAAELNTVQSNVTSRIRRLEERLGTPLFDRHSRGVTLTAAGRRLLPYAVQAGSLLDTARRAVEEDGTPKGPLTVGSLETTAAFRLSPILARYVADFPEVDLVLRTGTTRELIDAVLERRVEGAFVCGPVEHEELEQETVFREELVIASSPKTGSLDELAGKEGLKIIVLRAGCSYRQRLEEILARRGRSSPARVRYNRIHRQLRRGRAGHNPPADRCRRRSGARRAHRDPPAAGSGSDGGDPVHPPPGRLCLERAIHVHRPCPPRRQPVECGRLNAAG